VLRNLLLLLALSGFALANPLLVLSIDGLDHRYLRDADKLGLRIPNIRRLLREGQWAAQGVVGVVPTVTWPSHTSMISGVPPSVHGILNNKRPKDQGGEYYWSVDLLKVPTLLDAMRAAGRKSAAITWPVTVNALVDFNLPEYFEGRNGGAMDLAAIEKKATPGLIAEITRKYPSFPKQWVDDRGRAQALMFLLAEKKPDLLLVHFVDLDSEAHENGPFSREANAILEYTDELIGDVLRVMPKDYVLALVSDHGFERTDRHVNLKPLAGDGVTIAPYLATATTPEAATRLRELARTKPESGLGREVPKAELPAGAVAAWEPAIHLAFGAEPLAKPRGNHGFWPTRTDYRSTFVLWGPGVKQDRLPEIQMTSLAERFAKVLRLTWPVKR